MFLKVGKVINYYNKTGFVLISLVSDLAASEKIKFQYDQRDVLATTVQFLQIGHKKVASAKAGTVVGLKIDEKVEIGTQVFKMVQSKLDS